MLSIKRKFDEEIVIDGGIRLKVLGFKCQGGRAQVVLGIHAPTTTPVHRREIYRQLLDLRSTRLRRLVKTDEPEPPRDSRLAMLTLRRYAGEEIWIGHDAAIKVIVSQIGLGYCSLNIDAPREIRIQRAEAQTAGRSR